MNANVVAATILAIGLVAGGFLAGGRYSISQLDANHVAKLDRWTGGLEVCQVSWNTKPTCAWEWEYIDQPTPKHSN